MRAALLVVPIAIVLASCDATTRSGPTVTVMRVTSKTCLELLSDTPPDDALGLAEPCEASSTATPLLAGIDQLQLVIDYGDVAFTASTEIPTPTVTVEVDGKATMISPSVASRPQKGGHAWFVVTFTVPNVVSQNMQIQVDVATGFSTRLTKTFQTVAPAPAVSALRKTKDGCFSVMTPTMPDPMLGLTDVCGTATTALNAAVDLVELVIDYGALDVAASSVPPAPVISVSIDGTQVATTAALSPLQRVHDHLFYLATFHAPAAISSNMRISVATVGTGTPLETVFSTVPPMPTIDVVECPGTGACEVRGAVGIVHLHVTVPGDVPQQVVFHSYFDGVPGPEPAVPVMTTVGNGVTEKTVEIPVPAAADGTTWSLEAQVGPAHAPPIPITVRKPAVLATLSCTTCGVSSGTSVGLTVTAPKDIREHTAIYSTQLDGVPQISNATLDLTSLDVGAATVSNTVTLTAPAPGTWTIKVSVAGYFANTIVAHVQ